jgi:hypothetical protein
VLNTLQDLLPEKLNKNYLLILKILLVTHFRDPTAAALTQKMLTESRPWA